MMPRQNPPAMDGLPNVQKTLQMYAFNFSSSLIHESNARSWPDAAYMVRIAAECG